jgi:catechol 2,3-dioxygenase-like lactoylglutathione lyase family enzyme
MTLVSWQDLCIDAVDVDVMSQFWSAVSGLEVADVEPPARLKGATRRHTLWVNPVDRPHRAKNRVHLDVDCASVAELVDLGATVFAPAELTGLGWTVMTDPEGNEFCAFVRDELPEFRIHGIVVDSADPERVATWWGEALGAELTDNAEHGGGWWTLLHATPDDTLTMDFVPVPEPKLVKNRVHWDVIGTVEEFLDRGATHLWDRPRWTTLADPEGNEFCVFPRA